MSAEAVKRFRSSTVMNYDRWHDGDGFDLAALREMSADELAGVRASLRSAEQTWRELEALAVIDELTGTEDVRAALDAPDDDDNRIKAANLLFEDGKMPKAEYEKILCKAIRALVTHDSTTTRVLLYTQGLRTKKVKQALLWASWNRTDAAFHCAARLIYLCGKSDSPISFAHRPLLFDLQPNNNSFTREAAFKKLCALVGMELDTEQSY